MTNIRITALNNIGNDIAYSSLVPVVDMAGTPTTKKANLQILGNLILSGAGGSYFAPAARAILAQTVTNAAQPNITSVGTLTNLAVFGNTDLGAVGNVRITGGSAGQLLSTNGNGSLSWVTGSGSSYSNSNVASYLPTFTGTVGANTIQSTGASGSNVQINANGAVFMFGQGGALQWPAPGGQNWVIEPNIDNEFEIRSTSNVVISTDTSNANSHFTFDSDGIFTAPSNVNLLGTRLNIGAESPNISLETPTIVIADASNTFVQTALFNNDANGSADWVAYGEGGSDLEAWTDMGYAGHNFSDPNYTITPPGDGYLFVQGYANGVGGNMVLATGPNGNSADIVFATGGFLANAEFARIDHANNMFHLTRAGSGIKFQDGTIQTTAAGNPFDQDLNTTDNVTFANVTSTDAIRFSNSGNIVGALGYAPNYVSIEGYGSNSVYVTSNTAYTWAFNSDGNLAVPGNIISTVATGLTIGSNYDVFIVADRTDNNRTWKFDGTAGQLVLPNNGVIDPTDNNFEVRGIENVNFEANAAFNVYTNAFGNTYQWQFGDDGNLTLPGNTFAVNYANGTQVSFGGLPLANGTSNVNIATANGAVTLTADGNTWTFDPSGQLSFPGNQGYMYSPGGSDLRIVNNQNAGFVQLGWQDGAVLTPNANLASNVTLNSSGVVITTTADTYTTTNDWTFGTDGILTLPGSTAFLETAADQIFLFTSNAYLDGLRVLSNSFSEISSQGFVRIISDSNGNIWEWNFDASGNLELPGNLVFSGNVYTQLGYTWSTVDTVGGQVTFGNTQAGYFADNAGNASLYSTTDGGVGNSAAVGTDASAGSVLIRAGGANFAYRDWVFDNTGNLTLPGNTLAIKFANSTPAFGNMVQWTTAPVANTSAGTAGQAAYDSGGNLYVCVATNTWAKFAGTTSW